MRRVAGRMQTVGAGMLVLAVTVATPALSAGQQGAADPDAAPTDPPLTTPTPPPEPPAEGEPEDGSAGQDGASATEQVVSEAQAEATAPAPEPTPQKQAKVAAAKTVSIGDNFYSPATVTINVGDTVTWQNDGAAPHSATADNGSFDTERLQRRPEPLRDLQQRRHDLVLLHRPRPGPVGQGRGPLIGRRRWR